jgi:uncharacterized integral membrane protein
VPRDDGELLDGRKPTARLIVFAVIVAVLLWFALGNLDRVKVNFLVVHARVRLIYALVFAALLGALADRLATRRSRRH